MESERSYSSVMFQSSTFRRQSGSLSLAGGGTGFLGGSFGMGEDNQNAQGKGKDKGPASLQDISAHFRNISNPGRVNARGRDRDKDTLAQIRQQCMQYLMYLLFGDRHKRQLDSIFGGGSGGNISYQSYEMTNQYYYSESESTSFSVDGVVRTADGREIDFNLELSMSRSFSQYYEEHYEYNQIQYTDPLVINLDGNIAELSDQKFFFDLDCDGEMEEISSLGAGSGFLSLDLNGDGIINDGSELFGTQSGNGFADLAKYDVDGNGWIDENDPIFEKLTIWTKDENGNDVLYKLKDVGIGAIYLRSAATEFSLNSAKDNSNNGVIRSTGIFLYENGGVGTMQHLDLAR